VVAGNSFCLAADDQEMCAVAALRQNAEGDSMGQGTRNDRGNGESGVFPDSLAWDAMIRDAKKRIEELQLAIEIFEKKKAAGERWPGSPSAEQDTVPRKTM
jgi:hypothetical protein